MRIVNLCCGIRWRGAALLLAWTAVVSVALARPTPTTHPATAPADAEAASAVAVKVAGDVRTAPTTDAGQPPVWRPVTAGDQLGPGSRVRTGLRSSLLLQFGDSTIVKIDRVTLATVAQFYRTAQEQRVKLDLGYGAVRAGVAEGTLQSDMTIETPVATLTRRGTWNFGVEYEAVTGRYRMFLDDHGLVEALNQLTRERRLLLSGEYVTQAMIRWIETARFDRHVSIQEVFGLKGAEVTYNTLFDSGLGVVDPGAGPATLLARTSGVPGAAAGAAAAAAATGLVPLGALPFLPPGGAIDRPEGNFGTGGLIPPPAARAVRALRR